MNSKDKNLVTITAVSFESLAMDTDIGFAPPGSDLSSDPEGFVYHWRMIQFVFRLPDPAAMPPLPASEPNAAGLKAIRRFSQEADDLVRSQFLAYLTSLDVQVTQGEESVFFDAPPSENERGFAVHRRQFYGADERASFRRVADIAWLANEQAADEHVDTRKIVLKNWRQAEKKLRHRSVNVWVGLKLVREGRMGGPVPDQDAPSVQQLISAFSHGDLIHWGDKSDQLEGLTEEPFGDAYHRMLLYKGMAGLAHLYIGYSVLLRSLFGSLDTQ